MEAAAKFAVYLTLGVALLACNLWFIRTAYQAVTGGELVVAPVRIIGGAGDASIAGETLARMIISRLQMLEWDLRQSQSALRPETLSKKDGTKAKEGSGVPSVARPGGVTAGILGTPKTAILNAQLFEPTNIDIKVAGVDVSGLLPRIQSWFVADRTLAFSVSWEGKNAIVAGNIDALGVGGAKPIWISVENATAESIADAIALTLVHRQWARDSAEFGELEDDEFSKLVDSINEVARINRRVITYDVAGKTDFQHVLSDVSPLADRVSGWSELTYFVASVAEGAENYERALTLYRRLLSAQKSPVATEVLTAKITSLEGLATTATGETKNVALQKMQKFAADAARILNKLFALTLPDPEVQLISDTMLNAYWDGKKINAPSVVQEMPDIIYHEAAWPFIQSKWQFQYQGQPGALAQSYTDILASLVKQTLRNQNAKDADWVIAPGAIAWLTGKPNEIATDQRPLRSFKAPGTAYDDQTLGKDLQISDYSKLVKHPITADDDQGGIHIISGIPNRAFYETAIRIGSDKAGRIWISSLDQFTGTVDLRKASELIYKTAVRLYGEGSAEAEGVKAGWNAVGL